MFVEGPCIDQIARDAAFDSDISPVADADIVAKVSPLPIGLGFGPSRCHENRTDSSISLTSPTRGAILTLEPTTALGDRLPVPPPLTERKPRIFVGFWSSRFRDLRKHAYYELLSSWTDLSSRSSTYKLVEMYRHAFVAAPASRGQDTFRFWETISIGAIPIVLAGPLDFFYAYLPCVVVDSWANITEAKLFSWRAQIIARFGPRPYLHQQVAQLMSSSFYARIIEEGGAVLPRVQRRAPSGKEKGMRAFAIRARAVLNHTCNLTMGGVMPLALFNTNPRPSIARLVDLGCRND